MKSKADELEDEEREELLEEAKEELRLMGQIDEIITGSDLQGNSIARVLKYLTDRHLGARISDPQEESPMASIIRTVNENLPAILAAANAPKPVGIPADYPKATQKP